MKTAEYEKHQEGLSSNGVDPSRLSKLVGVPGNRGLCMQPGFIPQPRRRKQMFCDGTLAECVDRKGIKGIPGGRYVFVKHELAILYRV